MGVTLALGNTVKPPEPVGSREEIQNAVQWLARMTRSFAPNGLGGDALHVFFDPERRRFVTPEIAPATVLELSLPDLVLQFEEHGVPSPHAMDVDDKSSSEIEAWLLCEMLHRGFDRERFSKRLPYKSDHLLTGDERKYAPSLHIGDLQGHAATLAVASRLLRAVEHEANAEGGPSKGPLLCWPETLAIGFISPGRDGSVDLKVGYILADPRDAMPAMFFVTHGSEMVRADGPSMLAVDEQAMAERAPDASVERSLVEALVSMMASKRLSAAH